MTTIKTVWFAFGAVNTAVILPTNIYYSFYYAKKDLHRYRSIYSPFDRTTNAISQTVAEIIITVIKSSYFCLSGPIGTYRISLAFRNYTVTEDQRWLKALTHPGVSTKYSYLPYVIQPFGKASWIPK